MLCFFFICQWPYHSISWVYNCPNNRSMRDMGQGWDVPTSNSFHFICRPRKERGNFRRNRMLTYIFLLQDVQAVEAPAQGWMQQVGRKRRENNTGGGGARLWRQKNPHKNTKPKKRLTGHPWIFAIGACGPQKTKNSEHTSLRPEKESCLDNVTAQLTNVTNDYRLCFSSTFSKKKKKKVYIHTECGKQDNGHELMW